MSWIIIQYSVDLPGSILHDSKGVVIQLREQDTFPSYLHRGKKFYTRKTIPGFAVDIHERIDKLIKEFGKQGPLGLVVIEDHTIDDIKIDPNSDSRDSVVIKNETDRTDSLGRISI